MIILFLFLLLSVQCWFCFFVAITRPDILKAISILGTPNLNEARSVDARQEIDLKVGVAFTRFQTKYFHEKYGDLDSRLISYGPCQIPTLGFCVDRHDEIQRFRPEIYWRLVPTIQKNDIKSKLKWEREHVFDFHVANLFYNIVKKETIAKYENQRKNISLYCDFNKKKTE
jgi:DNA topoisomerase-3